MQTLEQTLSYRNDRVINKFRVMYALSLAEATEVATETLRWLWLNAQLNVDRKAGVTGIPKILVVHVGMIVMDEFWHTFILHTRDYEEFCQTYLGSFIHHSPGAPGFEPPSQEETELQLNYICETLGDDVMTRWYEEYPERFSPEALTKLQKPRIFARPCEAVTP